MVPATNCNWRIMKGLKSSLTVSLIQSQVRLMFQTVVRASNTVSVRPTRNVMLEPARLSRVILTAKRIQPMSLTIVTVKRIQPMSLTTMFRLLARPIPNVHTWPMTAALMLLATIYTGMCVVFHFKICHFSSCFLTVFYSCSNYEAQTTQNDNPVDPKCSAHPACSHLSGMCCPSSGPNGRMLYVSTNTTDLCALMFCTQWLIFSR